MSIKFYCNSETCTHADKGPFVIELPTGAVMDKNNMATVFCPRCAKPMKPLPSDTQTDAMHHRFYCFNKSCSQEEKGLFFIDLPGEAIMDKNNIATIFCPKCGKKMKSFSLASTTAINF